MNRVLVRVGFGLLLLASLSALAAGQDAQTAGPKPAFPDGDPRFALTAVNDEAVDVGGTMPINLTDCSAINLVDIGSPVTVPLAGNVGTIDFDVVYNGVTTSNVSAGNFSTANNVVGNVGMITTRANGFDAIGNPVSDEVVCSLDYNVPAPVCTQSPDSTVTPVDIGTVVTLTLTSTNTVSVTVDNNPIGVAAGTPNTDFSTVWEATHTALFDTVIIAQAFNPDVDTTGCFWRININRRLSVAVTPTAGLITNEAGGSDTFSVVLDQDPPLQNVTIPLSSSDVGEGTVSPFRLTFTPANYNVPQVVTVTGVDDAVVDGDQAYTIVTGAILSSDPEFNGIDPADVGVTNTDDDSAVGPAVQQIPTLQSAMLAMLALLMLSIGGLAIRMRN